MKDVTFILSFVYKIVLQIGGDVELKDMGVEWFKRQF
jgi:hypothetical protein